jgi:hypothetical protein
VARRLDLPRAAAAALTAAAILAASLAGAQDPLPITLRWTAPAECPSQDVFRARVDQLLAGASAGRALEADIVVTRGAAELVMAMRLTDESGVGERQLSAQSCDEIAEAGALIVALAYDPEAVAANQASSEPAPQASGGGDLGGDEVAGGGGGAAAPGTPQILPIAPIVPMPAAPPPVAVGPAPPRSPPPPLPQPEPPPELRFVVAPFVGVEIGTLPSAAAAIGGGVGLRYYPFEAQLRASYLVPVDDTLPLRPSAGGDFTRWAVGPNLCLQPFRTERRKAREIGGVRLGTCVGLEIGRLTGQGFGVASPGQGSALWVTPWAEGRASFTLVEWLELEPSVGFGFPLSRPNFVLTTVGIVHRASVVVGRLGLDVAVVF